MTPGKMMPLGMPFYTVQRDLVALCPLAHMAAVMEVESGSDGFHMHQGHFRQYGHQEVRILVGHTGGHYKKCWWKMYLLAMLMDCQKVLIC